MPTSPGPLLQSLHAVWEHLRTELPDLPDARISVSPGKSTPDHRWDRLSLDTDGVVVGLVMSAATLTDGPDAVVSAVLHEAAHVLCWVRKTPDTTMRGGYHNQKYLVAAEEVGLHWGPNDKRGSSRGYYVTELSEHAKHRHADDLTDLAAAIPQALPHLVSPPSSKAQRTERIALACSCEPARRMLMFGRVAAQGPVLCGVCNQPFKPV
ncbi:hypothetical protein [Streptomyces sp. NPDC091212]|uniref:hypothetical protein n=1 Tax=Streptomyces sp. NPDC091212 TaxID=3155191 RepID=UPI0034362CF9